MTESTQEEQKHPGGRPLKFESVEDLEVRINLHFDDCDKREDTRQWSHDEIITIDGKQTCRSCGKASLKAEIRRRYQATLRLNNPIPRTWLNPAKIALRTWAQASRGSMLQ